MPMKIGPQDEREEGEAPSCLCSNRGRFTRFCKRTSAGRARSAILLHIFRLAAELQ
jgi:hypothetical protein